MTANDMKAVKTEQMGMRLSTEARALLKAAAAKERRSQSNMVEYLIYSYCETNGITAPSDEQENTTSRDINE